MEVFDHATHSLRSAKNWSQNSDASSFVPNLLRDLLGMHQWLHCSGGPWPLAKSTPVQNSLYYPTLSNFLPTCVWIDRQRLVKKSAFLPLRNRHGGHLRMIAQVIKWIFKSRRPKRGDSQYPDIQVSCWRLVLIWITFILGLLSWLGIKK